MLPLIPLAIAGAPAVIKGVSGLLQSRKGNKLGKNNIRPDFEIPKEFQQNLAIAENMSKTGLPQQQYNNALNNIGRNQAGALRSFGRGTNTGNLASLLRASNDATLNLDAQDAGARMNNQRFAIGQRGQMGQLQLQKQQWEKMDKYNQQADEASALKGAGRQNTFGALNDLSSLGQLAIMGGQFGQGGGGSSKMAGTSSMPQFNPSQYLLGQGMPNPMTTQPMSGFPFEGFGGQSNQSKLLAKYKGYNPYKNY